MLVTKRSGTGAAKDNGEGGKAIQNSETNYQNHHQTIKYMTTIMCSV